MDNSQKIRLETTENSEEKKKDSIIKFRIASEEKVLVSEKAESKGLNVSEYIRRLALNDAERVLSK